MGPIASVEDKRRLATVKCGLSVPSSSGKSLERFLGILRLFHIKSFSPLFIGEVSGTARGLRRGTRRKSFQSPLHRGSLWNAMQIVCPKCDAVLFQSPLHRGSLWNPAAAQAPRCIVCLSVPSSSGKSLEHSWSTTSVTVTSVFQSPLHRGSLWNC